MWRNCCAPELRDYRDGCRASLCGDSNGSYARNRSMRCSRPPRVCATPNSATRHSNVSACHTQPKALTASATAVAAGHIRVQPPSRRSRRHLPDPFSPLHLRSRSAFHRQRPAYGAQTAARLFVPINKHGSQSRMAASAVDAAFASDDPVFVFPAGLCSRKGPGGIIRDLRWNKMFVNKSAENGRTVIPLRFHGENSKFFYNFAKIRAKSGLKFNIEMLCLPRELFLARGKQFRISILDPIGPELLTPGSKAAACADKIREKFTQNK